MGKGMGFGTRETWHQPLPLSRCMTLSLTSHTCKMGTVIVPLPQTRGKQSASSTNKGCYNKHQTHS